MLLSGESYENCARQLEKFFELTSLVRYDRIEIVRDESLCGLDGNFFQRIEQAQQKNRKIVGGLLDELKAGGLDCVDGIADIEQGYLSKTFHVLSHFLDGFIGIDSHFYNLIDDSHWLLPKTAEQIRSQPKTYWLLRINGYSKTPNEAGIIRM